MPHNIDLQNRLKEIQGFKETVREWEFDAEEKHEKSHDESKGNKNGKDEEDNNLQTAPMHESKRVKSMIKGEGNPRSKKTQITVAWQRIPTRMRKKFTGIDERTDEYNDEYRDKDKVSGLRFT